MNSNKKIAKNTIFLYFRLLFTLTIGLYSTRVILNTLGVIDYGIYNVVGGLVGIFSFLHGSLSGATTRFLNIAMIEDKLEIQKIFNTAIILHLLLTLLVLVFAETLGLWLLYNKLSIPINRFSTAFWVYQISVISIMITIMQIPYDAAIIANEKMNIYAYLSIVESILKLIAIFLVTLFSFDKLLLFAIFIFVVSILIRLIAQIYCRKNFQETKFLFLLDKVKFKQMLHFFGLDLYGNLSVVASSQGINILQNMFFGTKVNASIGVVNQAQGGIASLGSNFSLAIKPQLIQSYAKRDFDRMFVLLKQGTRLNFFLMLIVALPVALNSDFFLNLWLGEVPSYASEFLKLALYNVILTMLFSLLSFVIHATGKMVLISFLTGTLYLIMLPITYLFFKFGYNPLIPYLVSLVITVLAGISNIYIVKKYVPEFDIKDFIIKVIMKLLLIYLFLIIISIFLINFLDLSSIENVILIVILSGFTVSIFGVSKNERKMILNGIKSKF